MRGGRGRNGLKRGMSESSSFDGSGSFLCDGRGRNGLEFGVRESSLSLEL